MRRQVEVSKPKPKSKPKPFYQRKTKTMKLEVVATPPVGWHRRLANGSSSAGIAPVALTQPTPNSEEPLNNCTTLEVDFNITALPPTLNSLLVSATIAGDLHVGVSGEYKGSLKTQVPIMPTLPSDPIQVDVFGVPVVLTANVTFFVGASGTLNGSFSAGANQTASLTLGLSYGGGQFSPIDTWTHQFTEDPVVFDASLTAKVYGGAKIGVLVDEILTPSASPDPFLQLGVDFSANPWWTLSGGVELSACSVALDIFGIGGGLDCPDDLIQQLQLSFPIGRASGGFLPSDTTPSITSITPDSVAAGSSGVTLTLTGANFAPGATLNFNGAALPSVFVSTSKITAMLPAGDLTTGGTFPITVTNPGPNGGTSPGFDFKVQAANNPKPTITNLSPSSASAGSSPLTLTINGSGFIASSAVTFNSVSHAATFVNSSRLTISLSASDLAAVGSFAVVVSNPAPGGGASNAAAFTVASPGGPVSVSITEYPVPTTSVFIQANGNPYGIAAGPDGALWFTEGIANKIGRITTTGAFTEYPVPTPFSGLDPITAGPDGALWFTEGFAGKIGKITTGGVITEYPVPSSANPYGITAGPDGALWFTENTANNIGRITTAGAITEYSVSTFGGPLWIALGPDGALWFTEANAYPQHIGRVTTDGLLTDDPVPTPSCDVIGITPGPDRALWFAEQTAGNVGRITTAGVVTEYTAPTGLSGPYGITAGRDGAIWFTEYWGNKIGRAGLTATAAPPTITQLSPSQASAGSGPITLTIYGTGFTNMSSVTFNGTQQTLTFVSATQLTVTLSATELAIAGTYAVVVTNPGSSSASATFTVANAGFSLGSFGISASVIIGNQALSAQISALGPQVYLVEMDDESAFPAFPQFKVWLSSSSPSITGSSVTFSGGVYADSGSYYEADSTTEVDEFGFTLTINFGALAVGAPISGTVAFGFGSQGTVQGTFTGTISSLD